MELHELIRMTTLINRLAKRALFAEEQMVALEGQCAEWKRIADELKAERNAEREQHTAIKQALGVQAAKEAGKVLGMVEGEGLRGAAERVIKERDALRAQLDTERERHKQTATILAQYAPKTMQIEPPPEATHDTPAGKQAAESAVKREPKPGDTVRLVRFPTPKECREWSDEFGKIGELATVMSDDDEPCPFCVSVVRSEGCMNWPLSCIEVVKGGDK